jgi:quinol monooxygenase YgiN
MTRTVSYLMALLLVGSFASAQTRVDALPATAFHAVSYVEVLNTAPAHSTALAALKTYQTAAKSLEGFVRFEAYEQEGKPGHFVFLETWQEQAAYDKNAPAIQKQLADALQPIRISELDRRPYKTLHVAASSRPTRDTVFVITHVDASPATGVAMMLQRLAEGSRREEQNLRFDVLQHTQRANHFTVIEAWADRRAHDRHAAAVHTRQYRDEFAPMAGSPLDERLFRILEQ